MVSGLVFDIQNYSIYDGPGIRSTVYLKGCPLRCFWCHNPESQECRPESMLRAGSKELVGTEMTVTAVIDRVLADRAFFDHSGGGVTLTGGEPAFQPEFTMAILRRLHAEKIHTALETCGLFSSDVLEDLLGLVDLFLFDLKHMNPEAHQAGTRADNRKILQNFEAIMAWAGSSRITPRIPLIPGFNADSENLEATLRFLEKQGYSGEVHLMPHHGWARGKYEGLGRAADYRDAGEVPPETLAAFANLVNSRGFKAVCYG